MIDIIIGVLPYIAAMLVAVLFFAVYRGGLKKQAKQLLLCLVNTAEQTYGGGCGKLKYSAVASKLYEMMPKLFKFIFSEKISFFRPVPFCVSVPNKKDIRKGVLLIWRN